MDYNCSKCGFYHSEGWISCNSCGAINPKMRASLPIISEPPPRMPIPVAIDNEYDGVIYCERGSSLEGVEGRLLALIPVDNCAWELVVKRKGDSEITALRREIGRVQHELHAYLNKHKQLEKEKENCASMLEREQAARKLAEARSVEFDGKYRAANALLSKIKLAIGSMHYDEIVAAKD